MDSQTLKPNVQELQSDVIDREQISLLMNRASTALSSDVASQKYAEFEQQVSTRKTCKEHHRISK